MNAAATNMRYALSEQDDLERQEQAFRSVWNGNSPLNNRERLVWAALATEAWEGVHTLNMQAVCAKASCKPVQVERALVSLQQHKLLELVNGVFMVFSL